MNIDGIRWHGEEDRAPVVQSFCDCGTCQSAKPEGAVAMFSASNAEGDGFTIYLYDEETWDLFASIFEGVA